MAEPIRDALRTNDIIPDVLDDFQSRFSLNITYPSTHTEAKLGNKIPITKAQDSPRYEFSPIGSSDSTSNSNQAYTLVLTDPGAKSREEPIWSEFCHWIMVNVSSTQEGGRVASSEESGEKVIEKYMPPSPPQGTGYHRYVFVLLRRDAEATGKFKAPKERKQWGYGKQRHGVHQWASEYGLDVVGANFFFAQHE
ncbi:carboxypeptidase Y inhibitor [Ophidiomyces ophidiicola]|nr:carboxypeptidase Y inhibitor [Ophidiomyces ophidiicola]KAI1962933.1 carboxypeptidase Y inhibitor [Ophidiomyces ophidiicola]